MAITMSSTSSSSSSNSMIEDNIKRADQIIHKWKIDSHAHPKSFVSIFHQNNTSEFTLFLNCVTQLQKSMHFLASNHKKSPNLFVAQRLMQIAMKRLEKEFHQILSDNREYLNPESVSIRSSRSSRSSTNSDKERKLKISVSDAKQPSKTAILNLRLIAETMISCGYAKECIGVYKMIRKSTIDEALSHLGIKRYKCSHIQHMITATHIHNHVKSWLDAVQIAVKTLFQAEKFLCDNVFTSHAAIRDLCFTNSTKEGALNLFNFPELVINRCKRMKSETIFIIVDLYNSISYLWPEIESLFSNESVSSVKVQAESCLHKLGDSIRTFLTELESSIHKNSCEVTVTGGGIHPLNNLVMTYLSSLSDYGTAFNDVNFASIILVLLCKLNVKSKFHNYEELSYLFLVNNLHFIIEKVKETNLKLILGDEWIMKHEKKLKKYVTSYESMSWNKVILCLPESALVSPEKVKACFRRLYFTFEEVYGKQTEWIVVDEKMRGKMKASIANNLVPAYEEFYVKHLVMLSEDERCVKMLLRLSPENMAKCLSELFPGTSTVLRRS